MPAAPASSPQRLLERGHLHDTPTVSGKTLHEEAAARRRNPRPARHPPLVDTRSSQPAASSSSKAISRPKAASSKSPATSASTTPAPPASSTPKTLCFAAVEAGKINPGDVLVIRYEGPRGGPGMREMLAVTAAIKGIPELSRHRRSPNRRPLLRRHPRPHGRPRRPRSPPRRPHRRRPRRRHHHLRHPQPHPHPQRPRRRNRRTASPPSTPPPHATNAASSPNTPTPSPPPAKEPSPHDPPPSMSSPHESNQPYPGPPLRHLDGSAREVERPPHLASVSRLRRCLFYAVILNEVKDPCISLLL